MTKPIGIAVLGLGNVGREVVRIIESSAADLTARIGAPLELRGVAVRSVSGDRTVPASMLTENVEELVRCDVGTAAGGVGGPVGPLLGLVGHDSGDNRQITASDRASGEFALLGQDVVPVVKAVAQLADRPVPERSGFDGSRSRVLAANRFDRLRRLR